MLSNIGVVIDEVVRELAQFGKEATFFVPTETGLHKSIIDAHAQFRTYLLAHKIHDYSSQGQGVNFKKILPVTLILADQTIELEMSLYRPTTKSGDPRFWISSLSKYVKPRNLISLLIDKNGKMFLFNCSDTSIWGQRNDPTTFLGQLLRESNASDVAIELLSKLREISAMGFIPTMKDGDTGIGFTLESLLGIKSNSNKAPDFKGIELKSARSKGGNRSNLFAKVPNWTLSNYKSSSEVLKAFGYNDKETGQLRLYVTLSNRPNTQGLFLRMSKSGLLIEALKKEEESLGSNAVVWNLSDLRNDLSVKHRETFWISTDVKLDHGKETFHYKSVVHTRNPFVNNFEILVETGKITVDFLIKELASGAAKDKGYLWKIKEKDFGLIFPPADKYDLLSDNF